MRDVRQLAAKLGKQTAQWGNAVNTVDKALRDFGDLEHHLSVIQSDMEELTALIKRAAERKAAQANAPAPNKGGPGPLP